MRFAHFHSDGDDDGYESDEGGEWIIEESIARATKDVLCFARIACTSPSYPELRLEGANGITEFDFVRGSCKAIESISDIKIFPENFPGNKSFLYTDAEIES
jgi:hypothetical protein